MEVLATKKCEMAQEWQTARSQFRLRLEDGAGTVDMDSEILGHQLDA